MVKYCDNCKAQITKKTDLFSVKQTDGKKVYNFCSKSCLNWFFRTPEEIAEYEKGQQEAIREAMIKSKMEEELEQTQLFKEQEKLRNDQIKDNNIEQYTKDNSILSYNDVWNLFEKIFDEVLLVKGHYDRCSKFNTELRKLANENAEKILNKKAPMKPYPILEREKSLWRQQDGCAWQQIQKERCNAVSFLNDTKTIARLQEISRIHVPAESYGKKLSEIEWKKAREDLEKAIDKYFELKNDRADKVIIYMESRVKAEDILGFYFTCPNCDFKAIRSGDKHCSECGTPIEWK